MTQTEAKAAQEAQDLIKSFGTFDVYSKMKEAATELGIEQPVFGKIWQAGERKLAAEKEKLTKAADWLRVILNDSKEKN